LGVPADQPEQHHAGDADEQPDLGGLDGGEQRRVVEQAQEEPIGEEDSQPPENEINERHLQRTSIGRRNFIEGGPDPSWPTLVA